MPHRCAAVVARSRVERLVSTAGRWSLIRAVPSDTRGWSRGVGSCLVAREGVRVESGRPMSERSRITRDDLEERFKLLQDDVSEITETKKASLTMLGVAGIAAGILVAYFLGRRGGRRRRGVIEIRR